MASNTTTQVTVAIAQSTLIKIYKDNSYVFWKLLPTDGIRGRLCLDRLNEIVISGQTGSVTSDAADFFALLT